MILDIASGKSRAVAPDLAPYPWTYLRWSPDGSRLLLARRDGDIAELDVRTGSMLRRFGVGGDLLDGITCAGTDVIVGRTTWFGDLWTAQLR